MNNLLPPRVEKNPFFNTVFKAVPAVVQAPGSREAEGGGGQCADERDLRFLGVIGVFFECAQRMLVRILRIRVDRVAYRNLSDRARNKPVKLPAVTGGPD